MKRECGLASCDRTSDGYLCRPCSARYERDLAETPWLVDELRTALARQTRYGDGNAGHAIGRSRPMPIDVRSTNALRRYRNALVRVAQALNVPTWDLFVADPELATIVLARRLLPDANAVRFLENGPDLVDQVRRAFAYARHVVDRPDDEWFAGPCVECERDLYVTPGEAVVKCRPCGLSYDVAARRDYLLDEAEDQIVNAVTVARAVSWLGAEPLTAARVRKWAERGRLVAKAFDRCERHRNDVIPPACRRCQPLYRIGDAIDLLASDTHKRESTS